MHKYQIQILNLIRIVHDVHQTLQRILRGGSLSQQAIVYVESCLNDPH